VGAAGRGRAKSGTHGVAAEGWGGGGGWQNFPRVGGRRSQTAATAEGARAWVDIPRAQACVGGVGRLSNKRLAATRMGSR
jgi:hypothetical protein